MYKYMELTNVSTDKNQNNVKSFGSIPTSFGAEEKTQSYYEHVSILFDHNMYM